MTDWVGRMNRVMDYIEANLADEISYDKAAQIACCTTVHLQRMFSFVTGVPLSLYIRQRRMTLAAIELQSGGGKVIDISFKYGYDSPEAFSRAFKKTHGTMPSAMHSAGISFKAYPKMIFTVPVKTDAEIKVRLEQLDGFTLCGAAAVMDGSRMTPPKFLKQLHGDGRLRNMYSDLSIACLPSDAPCTPGEPKSLFFASYNYRADDSFTYMVGHNAPQAGVPHGYETLCVPASAWVVFTSPKDVGADPAVQCKRAWSRTAEWFATSVYEHACGPELEKGYNHGHMDFEYEVWIPVVRKE